MRKIFCILLLTIVALTVASLGLAEEAYGYGYIDRNGNVVISPQFDYAYNFSNDLARIFSGTLDRWGSPDEGYYGFINRNGETVIQTKYEKATDFKNGISLVKKNGKYGAINSSDTAFIDFLYNYMSFEGDYIDAFVGTVSNGFPQKGTHTIYSLDGKKIFSITCKSVFAFEGYFVAYNGNKYAFVDLSGKLLTKYTYDSITSESETMIGFKKGDDYGFMDLNGKTVIDAKYDSIGRFIDGKAIVKENGKYYLIDTTGNILVTYKADYVGMSPVDGYTCAFEGSLSKYGFPESGKYYLMEIDGNYVTKGYVNCYDIDSATKTWRVQEGGKWYLLDMQGNSLIPPVEGEYFYTCGADRFAVEKNDVYALMDFNGNFLTGFDFNDLKPTEDELIAIQIAKIEPDFRQTRWGMSMEEVKALEGSNPDYSGKLDGVNANFIGYDSKLMGNDVLVAFYFGPDGLYEAGYIWQESHSNDSIYISDYNSVKEQLTKKYGSPMYDDESWDTASHKNYYSDRKGEALSYGYLTYDTWYELSRTNIMMSMSADNDNISFIIFYTSNTISAPKEDYSDLF